MCFIPEEFNLRISRRFFKVINSNSGSAFWKSNRLQKSAPWSRIVAFSGIECPRGARNGPGGVMKADPYSDEALSLTKDMCMHREVLSQTLLLWLEPGPILWSVRWSYYVIMTVWKKYRYRLLQVEAIFVTSQHVGRESQTGRDYSEISYSLQVSRCSRSNLFHVMIM